MAYQGGERRGCPYYYCQAHVLLIGPTKSVIRKHPYEHFGTCPGSGYDVKKPQMAQDALMKKREEAMLGQSTKET